MTLLLPMKNVTIYAALVSWFWMAAVVVCHAESKKPNIVFILADDMGYGDLKAYNRKARSPRRTSTSWPPVA